MIAVKDLSKKEINKRTKSNILVVDDDKTHAESIADSIERLGHNCIITTNKKECLEIINDSEIGIDIVITDLIMQDIDGMEILRIAKEKIQDVEVILVTGYGTVENAVNAMQKGAATFLMKPLNINQLRCVVDKISEKQSLVKENADLQEQLNEKFGFEGILGNSNKMKRVFDTLKQIAGTSVTVLITGESGTGKELIARAIHFNSPRKNKPFAVLHTSAVSQSLMESELFGHEKGAFTGALNSRKGKFEYADTGTLFLDELGDMCLSTQAKLLRVLEARQVTPIGSNVPINVDVRIISASHRNFEELIKDGQFREDLYYRLNVVSIELPPLRKRKEDIPILIDSFIDEFSKRHNREVKQMALDARKILYLYDWPGNVRELRNCVESMVVVNQTDLLRADDIPEHIIGVKEIDSAESGCFAGMSLAETEKQLIKATLTSVGGKRGNAAKILGIGERTLYRKLDRYNLK